jgi:uncharacterized repeat protein (TIGR02543 family)
MPGNSMTLYAHWTAIPKFAVGFDKNGGETDANPGVMYITQNEPIGTLPSPPTRHGYIFVGWFNTSSTSGGTEYKAASVITSPITVYARWSANSYTVYWDATGGSVSPSYNTLLYGTNVTFPQTPSKTGYTFDGWYDAATGGVKFTVLTMPVGGKTLYAHWVELPKYTVTFNKNGGTTEANPTSLAITQNTTIVNWPNPPTKTGYSFVEWADTPSESGGTSYNSSTKITAAVTLYARWHLNPITIYWDAQGGTVFPTSSNGPPGSLIGFPGTVAKTGYSFAGWFTSATGGTQLSAPFYVPNSSVTYYARWTVVGTVEVKTINGKTWEIHTFVSSDSPATISFDSAHLPAKIELLVVAGGGGGGGGAVRGTSYPGTSGGGGGAGGLYYHDSFVPQAGNYEIIVGKGGAGGGYSNGNVFYGADGTLSKFGSISVAGGGGGAPLSDTASGSGRPGGSGGGGSGPYGTGGASTLPTNDSHYHGTAGGSGGVLTESPYHRYSENGGGAKISGTSGIYIRAGEGLDYNFYGTGNQRYSEGGAKNDSTHTNAIKPYGYGYGPNVANTGSGGQAGCEAPGYAGSDGIVIFRFQK